MNYAQSPAKLRYWTFMKKCPVRAKGAHMSWEFEALAGPFSFTEGPQWTGDAVVFSDMYNDRLMRYDPVSGETSVYRTETSRGNGLLWSKSGDLYCCEMVARRITRYEPDGTSTVIANRFEGKRFNRTNDIVMDSLGRIWFSDPCYGDDRQQMELDHDSIFRLTQMDDGRWEIERMTFDTTRPNGLVLSLDEKTLYLAQTDPDEGGKRELRAYPVGEDGTLSKYSVLHDFGGARGIDGMKVDSEDHIIATAGWKLSGPGPMLYVFEPSGRIHSTHPAPVDNPTNCCFGGADRRDLYVTTSTGQLFRAHTDLQGVLM